MSKSKFHPTKREKCYQRDGGRCGYCGDEVPWDDFTIDHLIPKSQGGTYIYENLVVACLPCNQSKSNLSVDRFRRYCYYMWKLGIEPPTKKQEKAMMAKFGFKPDYGEVRFYFEDHVPLLDPRSEMCYVPEHV